MAITGAPPTFEASKDEVKHRCGFFDADNRFVLYYISDIDRQGSAGRHRAGVAQW